jgi:anti-sigma factor RsiW
VNSVSCVSVVNRLSDYLDGNLEPREQHEITEHIAGCAACGERHATLVASLAAVRALPRLRPTESIAFQVLNRLEVESRGPGLALLFRPAWLARPLIFPSLVPAALVLVSVLAAALALDHEPRRGPAVPAMAADVRIAPAGTEANPLFPSAEVSVPRVRDRVGDRALASLTEGSLFFETVVARDGSVADVTLLDGEPVAAGPIRDALRLERFEPARLRGRPVAVSVYRLISHMEVTAPTT